MVRVRSILAAASLTMFTLLACGKTTSGGAAAPAAETVVTNADEGKTITLARGATLAVKLGLQSGTGFGWEVAKIDGGAVTQQGERTTEASSGQPGGSQLHVFRFAATAPGTSTIELAFRRPFDTGTPPVKTFHVTVTVQ